MLPLTCNMLRCKIKDVNQTGAGNKEWLKWKQIKYTNDWVWIKFSLYSFHVIHDYLTIRRQTRGFYLLIVDKGRRPKSTIKVNRAPINDTSARVIKTITSCEIAIQMMPILGIQTSLLHLVFYSIFEHFVIFLLCIIKCVNHEKRLQIWQHYEG